MKNAEMILYSDKIFTSTGGKPIAGGVAVKDDIILDVDSKEKIETYRGQTTKILDYTGKLIMPAFVDAHVHYFVGAIAASEHMCADLEGAGSEEECVNIMKKYAETHPDEKRLLGIGWFPASWGDAPLPSKKSLDKAFPDKPVYLIAADVHTFWMNTLALEEAGITSETNPESGEIGKFEDGSLSGLLFEPEAFLPAMAKVMEFDKATMKQINIDFMKYIASKGVGSISEMSADDYTDAAYRNYEVLREMEDEGEMACRMHLYTKLAGYHDFSQAVALNKKYNSKKLKHSGVKGFVDGVTSTYTAYMLEPYSDRSETTGIGTPLVLREEMQKSIIAANEAGLPVRLHCIGDAAVKMALDMFEESNKVNGNVSIANTIEHIESIAEVDISRFKELNVIPSMQPQHLPLDQNEKIVRIGEERCRWEWPHKTLLDSGAILAFGTDYPVVGFDPFPTLYAAVERKDEKRNPTGINSEESIPIEDSLIAYTKGAACAYGRGDELGTLEKGKLADIIVVSKDLLSVPSEEILDSEVLLTVVGGEVVYEK